MARNRKRLICRVEQAEIERSEGSDAGGDDPEYDVRELLVEAACEFIRRTPSDVLISYLPVLDKYAELEDAKPALRFVTESGVA